MLFGRGGNLRRHVGDIGHRLTDAHQRLIRLHHPRHAFFGLAMPGVHGLHGRRCGVLQLGDQRMNLPGGLGSALRQLANFVSHHRKTSAHLTGAGRFDGCVQCQQVGLVGNAFDHIDHTADFIAVLGQLGDGHTRLAHGHRQTLDRLAGFPGDIAAATGQAIGFLGGVRRALYMAGDFLSGRCHLVDRRGYLFGFHALAFQAAGAVMRQGIGLRSLVVQVFSRVLQACKTGLQPRFLAENRHLQPRLRASAVGVHLRDQRVRRGLLGQTQQTLEAALLPAQAQQAQWHRQARRQGKTPVGIERCTNHKAQLADQDKRQPVLQHRQPLVALRHGGLALVDALIERFGPADLLGGGLDAHRFVADHLVAVEDWRHIGVNPVVIAGLAAVLDDAHPWQALFERGPHVREHSRRNIRVTHQVVRRSDQFVAGEPTDFDESVVAVGDHTFGVCGGDQPLLSGEGTFALGNGLVITHGCSIRKAFRGYRRLRAFI